MAAQLRADADLGASFADAPENRCRKAQACTELGLGRKAAVVEAEPEVAPEPEPEAPKKRSRAKAAA